MRNRWNVLAWSVLGLVFAGMSLYLVLHPDRTGVVPNYRIATTKWWAGEPIYPGGTHGFLYFPNFIPLFTPFCLLRPEIFGEIAWRAFGFALFGWGLWKLAKLNHSIGWSGAANPAFFGIVLLAVPASLASINNGQSNLHLSASLMLGVLALREQGWNVAAVWFSLAILLKPIGLAPWLLAFAVFPAMRKPSLVGLLPLVTLGFAHPDIYYAWERWEKCIGKIILSYSPENLRVSDVFGALERAGVILPTLLVKAIRVGACAEALASLWCTFRRRGSGAASWVLWVGSAMVLTLFNPRAETNSYVLISPLLSFAAVNYWQSREGDKWKGVVLAAACIGLMCDGMGKTIYLATDVWLKPLIVLVVSPLLFRVPEKWKMASGRGEG